MSILPKILKGVVLNTVEQRLIRNPWKFVGGIHHATHGDSHVGACGGAHFGFEGGADGHYVAGAGFEVGFGNEFYRTIALEKFVIQGDGVVSFFSSPFPPSQTPS